MSREMGIYTPTPGTHNSKVTCAICQRIISRSALSRASHGKAHVREGVAVAGIIYGYDGPRSVFTAKKQHVESV